MGMKIKRCRFIHSSVNIIGFSGHYSATIHNNFKRFYLSFLGIGQFIRTNQAILKSCEIKCSNCGSSRYHHAACCVHCWTVCCSPFGWKVNLSLLFLTVHGGLSNIFLVYLSYSQYLLGEVGYAWTGTLVKGLPF